MNWKIKSLIKKRKLIRKQIKLPIDTPSWSVTKKNANASSTMVTPQSSIQFSFPKMSQTIYPAQSVQLGSGWAVSSLPNQGAMHIDPHKSLL